MTPPPPFRPPTSPSVVTSPKENPPALDTSLHVQRPDAAGPGATPASPHCSPDARPHFARAPPRPSRWLRVPGGGAHAEEAAEETADGPRSGRCARAIDGGGGVSGRRVGCAPSAAPAPPGPAGAAGVTVPGSRPRPRRPRVRFRFTTKSPGHRNPTGGQSRPGGPGQGREHGRRGRRWEGSARGEGDRRQGAGGWTYSGHSFGDAGPRNRFFQNQTENG